MNKSQLKEELDNYRRRSDFIKRATIETIIGETDSQREARIKFLLKPENYGLFFNYYFGKECSIPMADSDCAKFHIDTYKEIYKNDVITQFRLWSRGFAKSVHSDVGNPFALKQSGLIKFTTIIGITDPRAKLLLSDLQVHLESNQRIIRDFGEQKVYGSWIDGEFETQDGCYFLSLGIDQPFRGLRRFASRVDLAIVDDIEDRKVAKNERLVRERGEKILSDLAPAFGKNSKRMIIANNLIENKGVISYILNKKKESPYTKISRIDFLDKNKKTPWPERYTQRDIDITVKDNDPITFQREFMQIPVTEGALFKPDWIIYKQPLDYSKYNMLLGHWDLSYTDEGDYKAFCFLGATDTEIHVLDVFCRKCGITEATDYHFNFTKKLLSKGAAAIFFYDATAAQQAVYKEIFIQEAAKHRTYTIPLPEHASVDKYLRIEATLINLLFNKRLVFSEKIKDTPDLKTGLEQLLVFERGSKAHDDFPDTLEAGCRLIQTYIMPSEMNYTPIIGKHKRKGY